MRLSLGIVALVLAASLSACGSSSGAKASDTATTPAATGTPTVTVPAGGSLDCAKYVNTASQIAKAEANMFSGSASDFSTALDALKAEFSALKSGAPSDVQAAIDDLTSALADIAKMRANPTTADQAHLQALATKLPTDGQKISAYIATSCHA